MFKALMIIFVVSVGYSGSKPLVGDVDVVLFETKGQCEFAKDKIPEVAPGSWGRGEGDNRKDMELQMSVKCFDIPKEHQGKNLAEMIDSIDLSTGEVVIKDQEEERYHKRWNE